MAALKVRIWPSVADVHDGVNRYTAELVRALGSCEGVRLVDEGEDILHLVAAHRYPADWREAKALGRKLVVTVHDLIPEHEGLKGEQYGGVAERKAVLDAADTIVAVSQWTKDDVVRTYGINPDKIFVIHNGVWEKVERVGGGEQRKLDYLLWIGRRVGYKNFFWFVRAVAPFLWTHPKMLVVCTGGQAFGRRERLLLSFLGLARRFEVRQVTEDELVALYRGAYALVMPSRTEGFGLPVVEAMAQGCPVILPRAHVFPEIAGDAALFFRPWSARDLRRKIRDCAMPSCRDAAIARGYANAARFDWRKCAAEVMSAYESIMRARKTRMASHDT